MMGITGSRSGLRESHLLASFSVFFGVLFQSKLNVLNKKRSHLANPTSIIWTTS